MSESSVTDIQFSKRFSPNLITNIINLGLSFAIGILLVPYYIDTIGPVAYGLLPLATSVSSYIILITNALNSALSRYLMFDLRKGDIVGANNTFNTAFVTIFGIVILLIPVALVFAFFSPSIFNIGNQIASEVQILFALTFGAALLNILASNFELALFSYNRLDLKSIISIIRQVIQIGLIVLLFNIVSPSLHNVGIAYFSAAAVGLILSIIFSRKKCQELKLSLHFVTKSKFKALWSMTFWTLIRNLGFILRSNIGIIIVNITCGALIAAEFSIAFTWQTVLVTIVSSLVIIFEPMIFSYCAKKDDENLDIFLSLSTRTISMLAALIVVILTVFGPEILTLWVGNEYASLALLAFLLILPIILQGPVHNIQNVMIAQLKIWQNAVIFCISGVLVLIFGTIGACLFGVYGVALSYLIVWFFWDVLVVFTYVAKLQNHSKLYYLKLLIPSSIVLLSLGLIGYLIKTIFSWTPMILSLLLGITLICIIAWIMTTRILLSNEDRKMIRACLPQRLQKIIPMWIL